MGLGNPTAQLGHECKLIIRHVDAMTGVKRRGKVVAITCGKSITGDERRLSGSIQIHLKCQSSRKPAF